MNKRSSHDENTIRLRIFYLYRIFEQCTDENHSLTTPEIRDIMLKEYGIYVHRITVYYDVGRLKSAGVDIRCIR